MRGPIPILALALALPLAAAADQPPEIACIERNIPEPDSIRAVRISSRDRAGSERETVVKIFGRRSSEGDRQVLIEFLEPEDVKGSVFLMLERSGGNEMYFRPAALAKAKRVDGAGRALALLGSDFSYEDFEHLMAFRRPGQTNRLEDEEFRDRTVYVIETFPTPEANSAYSRIVTAIDQETCVALRTELYEKGRGLRKRLVINPERVHKKGEIWIPQLALMEDELNFTSTVFMIDSSDHEVALTDDLFTVDGISKKD